jgi:hypothetical protein
LLAKTSMLVLAGLLIATAFVAAPASADTCLTNNPALDVCYCAPFSGEGGRFITVWFHDEPHPIGFCPDA